MRIENFPEKSFDKGGPAFSLTHFGRSYSSWWNSNESPVSQSPAKCSDSKVKQADQLLQQGKHLGLQLPEQDSSLTQSPGQSCQEMSIGGGANSHEQSLSSESGQDESCGRSGEAENKPFFLFGSSEMVFNGSQADQTHPTVQVSYTPTGDPYSGFLVSGYGPPPLLQGSQMAGVTSARVPLPLTFAEDGPIFVNAKQYHGILRRRQSRAKLEAQNKFLKARKPYLHESRHRHALNRVRGSGGRFLGKEKNQETRTSSGSWVTDAANSRKEQGIENKSNREGFFYGKPEGRLFGNIHPAVVGGGGKSSLALY